ncbi:MAG: hypothetical protein A2Z16_12275 [Chloroflexi bacterium RBG_16_54_18]|nr:MAG: hypothetical protein A2Z16_12275 [Chloroflexi bacterium RBG_16_54_18]
MQSHHNQYIEKRLVVAILITGFIFLAELLGGYWTGSLALMSDAAHVFLDVFALLLSFFALRLSARPADDRHTFGYHRLEVLAALVNGVTLIVVAGVILREALQRWVNPEPIKSVPMLAIAAIGLVANIYVALTLRGESHRHGPTMHQHEDLNMRSAFLHVVGDALSSVGVIAAAGLIYVTGMTWFDPLISVLIGLMILLGSGRLVRRALHILVEGTPEGIKVSDIGQTLAEVPGVHEVHDLHVWSLCSGQISLSAHIVMDRDTSIKQGLMLIEMNRRLIENFGIEHTTLQIEPEHASQVQLIVPN